MRNAIASVFAAASILLFVAGCGGGGSDHTAPTAWYKDADGDGYSDGTFQISVVQPDGYYLTDDLSGISGDCDDGNPGINPGGAEACDAIDNNCDGAADEGTTITYYLDADGDGYGAAGSTVEACSAPSGYVADPSDCDDSLATVHPGAEELCDGLDDDCDTASADGSGDPQTGSACDGPDSDLCMEGIYSCATGGVLACSDDTESTVDACNGVDDDCDSASVDGSEDPQSGEACDGTDTDLCQEGTRYCSGGALACSDITASTVDFCNGVDDDCDPASVDGSEDPQSGAACDGTDTDLCNEGTLSCSGGGLVCSDNTGSTVDLCNGLNDDCDPASADGSEDPQFGTLCDGADTDLCQEGTRICSAGGLACSDNTGSTVDLCNGSDDDCDPASADGSEDPQFGTLCDGADSDLCQEGTRICSAGGLACSDATGSNADLCDGIDNDCDPDTPDGSGEFVIALACDGPDTDLCEEGGIVCVGGALGCSDNTGNTLDLCNGSDDDCDAASVDGSEDPQSGAACDGDDTDLCMEGVTACSDGALACSDPLDVDIEICDGLDNDCNPTTPDGAGDPQFGTLCDGEDSDLCNEGTLSCSSGALACSDISANTPDLCNGSDDDCDGSVDEDFTLGALCAEGVGGCSRVGGTICSVDGLSTVCDAVPGLPGEELCGNGIDDDCDGEWDEGFNDGDPCAAGQGECTASGYFICTFDRLSTVCDAVPGEPFAEVCDGLDNDCDGTADEGVAVTYFLDFDGDGYGDPDATQSACTMPTGYVANGDDCDDLDDSVNPEAVDIFDGIDNDCDGIVDGGAYSHTIAIDGTNDFEAADEQFATSSNGYNAYVAWDDTYLYVGYNVPDAAVWSGSRWLLIYVDGVAVNTMTTGVAYTTQQPSLPFAAGYHVALRAEGLPMAWVNDGTVWGDGLWDFTDDVAVSGTFAELRLPLADLGITAFPFGLRVHVSLIDETTGSEWSFATTPAASFTDGFDPDYTRYYEFVLGGTAAPNSYLVRP